jgi:hypothetical protein
MCRWHWQRGYIDKLSPIREAPALKFGTLVHEALEARYPKGIKRGPKPAETFEKLFIAQRKSAEEQFKMKVDDEWEDMLQVGIEMLEAYIEKYGRDEDWKVIASEMTFKTPAFIPESMREWAGRMSKLAGLSTAVISGDEPLFYYVGTMDGVWENRMDGGVRINDYKTTSHDPTKEAAGKYTLDEQATAYWTWGADALIDLKILKPRQVRALDGMLYTFLRKTRRDTRPVDAQGLALNKDGSVSKQQPLPMFHRELVYRSEAEREHARVRAVEEVIEMSAVRLGNLPAYKTPATGSMGHCGFCAVRDLCELDESDGDWQLLRKASFTTWEPYGSHEIKEEGKAR